MGASTDWTICRRDDPFHLFRRKIVEVGGSPGDVAFGYTADGFDIVSLHFFELLAGQMPFRTLWGQVLFISSRSSPVVAVLQIAEEPVPSVLMPRFIIVVDGVLTLVVYDVGLCEDISDVGLFHVGSWDDQ